MIKIEPLTPAERDAHRCAYCGKHLLPDAWRNSWECKTEEELAQYKTNRRVIQIRREMHTRYDHNDEVISKTLYKIHLKFLPDDDSDWGRDGVFCTGRCAEKFAHAAHRAGYRMQRKGKTVS